MPLQPPQTALSLLPSSSCFLPQRIKTGVPELDDYVLLGGLDKGSVVGLSCEDEEVGLLIALQTLTTYLLSDNNSSKTSSKGLLIINSQPIQPVLSTLRKCIINALSSGGGGGGGSGLQAQTKACLKRVGISRVFDSKGLEEVLDESESDLEVGMVVITGLGGLLLNGNIMESKEVLEGKLKKRKQKKKKRLILLLNTVKETRKMMMMMGNDEVDGGLNSLFDSGQEGRVKRAGYGKVFAGLVDLHLMGSKVAVDKEREEREKVWVMEVLFDEVGVYDLEKRERRDREGRWAVFGVDRGGASVR
ncbi:hypothetical protein QBC38DRAFT_470718 [Podospora fimiseda]|uniref:DNA recombination and repair protein Rad51-like C-terminal domain-containing protein n=1 Tax=Podospora fimiseda TaxID=252190 RepID=A0AAN7BV36_9PEZI|nr:hypothetical protein QBC38DRAFT_470718 [Podospora fimiseda]